MAQHRTTDKIFTNFDEDLSYKPAHCDTSSSSSNDGNSPGRDIIYTNSPTRHYPPSSVAMAVTESMGGGSSVPYIPLLKHLDTNNTGYLSAQCLLGYFDKLGMLDTGKTLEYLGIVGQEDMLDLNIVVAAINDHISNLVCYDKYSVYAAITALLCDEIIISQQSAGNLSLERDRLTEEMQDMHTKVNEMSKQINGIHYQHDLELQQKLMNCEQYWKEKMKMLEQRTKLDCKAYQSSMEELKRNSEMNAEEFEAIKSSLKNEIENLKQNNKGLEIKIDEMKSNLLKMEDLNTNLRSEVQKSKIINERLITIENCSHGVENDASLELIKNLEELMKANQALKDRNDELEINMLSIPLQKTEVKSVDDEKCIKRKVDYNNESPKMSPKTKWSKKSDLIEVDSIASLSDECDEILSLSDVDCSIDLPSGHLVDELDHVKMEILKMISEKKQAGGKQSEKDEKYQSKVFQLEQENKKLRRTIKDLHNGMKLNPKDQQLVDEKAIPIPDILVEQMPCIDRSSPDGQEREEENHHICHKEDTSVNNEKMEKLEQSNSELELSNNKLLEENKHLEESLELMQSEFESMEDYWQGKICDERRFYEDQVKVNESQFKELEVRMREYEDLLSIESNKSANNGGRLATIDEDRNLEEKVVEWEEEITHLHNTIDDMEVAYEQEMSAMKQKVSSLELKQSQCKCGELSVKRRNLESFWMKVVKSDTGPLSLPNVLFLKEAGKQKQEHDDTSHNKDGSRQDVFTQVPESSSSGLYESSLCSAYRSILADINREIQELTRELEGVLVHSCLQSRLAHITSRCYQLQYNLHQTRGHCANNIAVLKEQHESEMSQLESLVVSSQELLGKQSKKFMKELDKLVMTDLTIKTLIQENDNLTQAVNEMRLKVNNSTSNNKISSSSPGCDSERKGKDAIQNS